LGHHRKERDFLYLQELPDQPSRISRQDQAWQFVVIRVAVKTAFLDPVMKADLFDQTLLGDWLSSQATLEDWIAKFD
jgi:hypothetical protein